MIVNIQIILTTIVYVFTVHTFNVYFEIKLLRNTVLFGLEEGGERKPMGTQLKTLFKIKMKG